MLKIGEFSRLGQVSVKTLRYYDELGLLRPEWVDRYTGYRYYTLSQLARLNRILALRELGFPLVQIDRMLREDLTAQELQRLLVLRQRDLDRQVHEEQARLARIAARLRQIEQEGRQPRYEVLVKKVAPRLVAGIRDVITDRQDIASLARELRDQLRGRGCVPGPLSSCLAVYYDAEYLDRGADVEVAVPLERRLRDTARVSVHELPAIEAAASMVHQGGYESVSDAHRAFVAWAQSSGYRTAGPTREIYLQGFESDADPSSYVTELQFPLQDAATSPGTTQQEGKIMEPRIVNKPAFTVVGVPFTGLVTSAPFDNSDQNNEIGKAWDEFNARCSEIRDICGPAYGLCFGMPNDREPWYIAGIEVERAEQIPPGMMSRTVPAQKYAVFQCTLATLGATYRHITEEWQPRSGFEHADAPDFELYDEEFDAADAGHGKLSVYWPIK